jgi:hypothetical protein
MHIASSRVTSQQFGVVAIILFACISAGCGSNRGVATVQGKVLLDNKPLEAGYIATLPPSGRGAYGTITNGEFVLSTFGNNDGALIATHKVSVVANAPPQGVGAEATPGKSLVPERYTNPETSGLTIEVKAGEVNTPTLNLTST